LKENATMPEYELLGLKVLIRGAGEMATGVAHRLARSGFLVIMTEAARPLAVRRAVSFCEAVYEGAKTVEGLTARLIQRPEEAAGLWGRGELPVMVDPETACRESLRPAVMVDALLAKANTGLFRGMAPWTIGLGPGFRAPEEVDLAIETNRGHDLGRLIYEGEPQPNTGQPGEMAGYTHQRVLRAPAAGVFESERRLGERVEEGQEVGRVDGRPVTSGVSGVLRGLIRPGSPVSQGLKVGDVDPRGRVEYLETISEKARAIGGSVLEGIMARFNR
jgi:xanthine dehydrogenase accessory factor